MKMTFISILTLSLAILVSCKDNTKQDTQNSLQKEKSLAQEQVQFSEERIEFLYDSLWGKMPREEITPYIDSLQGKNTPAYKTPESWKLKNTEAIAILYDWNEKHNKHTASHHTIDYMDYVDFYGETKELEQITAIKESMFKRYPDFHQEIIPSSIATIGEESVERIEFTKKVTMDGKTKMYDSFLEFSGTMGAFFIVGEGDLN